MSCVGWDNALVQLHLKVLHAAMNALLGRSFTHIHMLHLLNLMRYFSQDIAFGGNLGMNNGRGRHYQI